MIRALALFIALQAVAVYEVSAATQVQVDQMWNRALKFMITSQHRDGGWSATVQDGNVARQALGPLATAAMVEALSLVSMKTGYSYLGAVSWLANADVAGVDALSRQAIALKAAGEDVAALAARLSASRNAGKSWGAYAGYEAALPDNALGIVALLDAQGAAYGSADLFAAVCPILLAQRSDALWSYSLSAVSTPPGSQTRSSVIATAQSLLALSKASARLAGGTCGATAYTLGAVMAAGVSGLIAKQSSVDKGFGDNGVSAVLETALALRALKAAAPTNASAPAALDYLLGQQGADGSWGADAFHTSEVLLALAAATTATGQRPSSSVTTDTDGDGVPDAVEVLLGTNSAVADSRFLSDNASPTVTTAASTRIASPSTFAPAPTVTRSKAIRKERRANAWVGRPHIELFIAGTAAELPALEQALRSMLDVASFETFSLAPQPSGELYRSYFGSLIDEGLPSLAGKRLLLHFSAEGGSYSAVASMLRAEPVTRMDVSDECEASAQLGRWFCRNLVWDRVPDGGISESDPAQARSFDPARPVVTVEELMQLDAAPVNRLRWGIEVSHALKASGVQRIPPAALRSIVSGSASSWAEVDRRLREMPIVLCRQPDAAAPMTLLGLACAIGAPKGSSVASASPGIITAPGRLVREVSSYADVRQCLYEADHGASILTDWGSMQLLPGSYAIAFLPRTSAGDDDRNWLSDDLGETTAWMQWLKANNSNMGRRPTAEQLAVLRRLRQMMSDAQLASLIPGALALSPAQRDGPQVPSARACAADARP